MAAPALSTDLNRGTRTRVITYTQSGANDGNVDVELHRPLAALTWQLTGTLAAGTVTIQGSNDGSTFVALPTATSFSAVGLKAVATADLGFRYYRAAFASMNSSNSLVLTMVAKMLV